MVGDCSPGGIQKAYAEGVKTVTENIYFPEDMEELIEFMRAAEKLDLDYTVRRIASERKNLFGILAREADYEMRLQAISDRRTHKINTCIRCGGKMVDVTKAADERRLYMCMECQHECEGDPAE